MSIDTVKSFDKTQHAFMIRTLIKGEEREHIST